MNYVRTGLALLAIVGATLGCSAKVETTEDSTKVTGEGPKLEIGDKPLDMDPATDDDLDLDTPAPGDK